MRTLFRKACVLASIAGCGVLLHGQTPASPPSEASPSPPATAFILGRVVDGVTNTPVSGVAVMLAPTILPAQQAIGAPPTSLSRLPLRVVTDGEGRFVFRELPANSYLLTTDKAGYSPGALGRRVPGETSSQALSLSEGERKGGVVLRVWKPVTIAGKVLDEAGEPLVGIQVRPIRREMFAGRVRITGGNPGTTDDRGMYRMAGLQPGEYAIAITSTLATVPTALQEATRNLSFTDPMMRELERSSSIGSLTVQTGQRVGDLLVNAQTGSPAGAGPIVRDDRVFVYPTTFHPAASVLSQATWMTLASGEARDGVDFQLRPVPTYRVSGQLSGPDGPEVFTAIELLAAGADDMQRDSDLAVAVTSTDRAGAFTFLGVPPGTYTARVLKIPARQINTTTTTLIQTGTTTISSSVGGGPPLVIPDTPTYSATASIAVSNDDVSGVSMRLEPGARITGRIEFDGTAAKLTPAQLRSLEVQVTRGDGRPVSANQFTLSRGAVDQDGRFKTYQLPQGRYVINTFLSSGTWSIKSAMWKDRDLLDVPVDLGSEDIADVVITMTDRPASISGTVRGAKGADVLTTVYLFPVSPALWNDHSSSARRFRSARAATDGTYRLNTIATGDYLIAAMSSVPPVDWMEPGFLRKLAAQATRISIGDGDKKVQDVDSKEVR